MPSQTEDFFEQYAKTLDRQIAGELANHHLLPCVFVLDEQKKIVNVREELELMNSRLIQALQSRGIIRHVPQVNQAIRLSDKVLFATVRWQFRDAQDNVQMTTHCSYTLQQVSDSEVKIIVEVIDDEDKVITSAMLRDKV